MTDFEDTVRRLTDFVMMAQVDLWYDLDDDLRSAQNGVWSMAASNRCVRIAQAARLVGPVATDVVPWRLVSGGVYYAVLDAAEVGYVRLSDAELRETDKKMGQYSPNLSRVFLAQTARTIMSRDETAYIRNGA